MSKKQVKTTGSDPATLVEVREARPNKMFSEEQRALVRFLRFSSAVPCAECGRRSKTHWTMLCEFKANTMAQFSIIPGKRLWPMAPVCTKHPMAPAFDD